LRNRLGLGNASPEFIRSLKLVSPDVAGADKTIQANSPTEWAPNSLRAAGRRPGRGKIGEGSVGKHGLRIKNWDVIKQFVEVEVEPSEDQQSFSATTGQTIARQKRPVKCSFDCKIKSEPSVPTKITYNSHSASGDGGEVSLDSSTRACCLPTATVLNGIPSFP